MESSSSQKRIADIDFRTIILELSNVNTWNLKKARALLRRAPGGGTYVSE